MKATLKNHQENRIAEIELSYRLPVNSASFPKIFTAEDAYKVLLSTWDLSRIDLVEQFKVMLINRGNRLLGIVEVSSGGIAGTVADPKLIFAAAVKSAASGIILAHNHPSGELVPSERDIEFTRKLMAGAALLEIEVVDHLVLGREGYVSLVEQGLV